MVPSQPAAALEVIEAEFVFQLAIVLFDLPSAAGGMDSRAQGGGGRARRIPQHPVVAGRGRIFGPLDQQPFLNPCRALLRSFLPAVSGPGFDQGEARSLGALGSSAPSYR